jgi:hypothetical protein
MIEIGQSMGEHDEANLMIKVGQDPVVKCI